MRKGATRTIKILLPIASISIALLTLETFLSFFNITVPQDFFSYFHPESSHNSSPYRLDLDNSKLIRKPLGQSEVLPGALIVPKRNHTFRYDLKQVTGETVYDVSYSVDQYRRRVTPDQRGNRNKHALFLGCSITYGEGSNNNDTIPYYFAQNAPSYRAYNFGYNGYGIQDILARARYKDENYWEGVKEEEGVAIYTFMYDHIRRLLGSMSYLARYGAPHPYLKEMPDGHLVNMGSFRDNRPYRVGFYKFLMERSLVRSLHLDLPFVGEKDWRYFARVVNEVKKEYLARFPRGKFIVFMIPRVVDELTNLRTYLDELGIETLDYSEHRLEDMVGEKTYHNPDSHLTPAANRYLARLLANSILSGNTQITGN